MSIISDGRSSSNQVKRLSVRGRCPHFALYEYQALFLDVLEQYGYEISLYGSITASLHTSAQVCISVGTYKMCLPWPHLEPYGWAQTISRQLLATLGRERSSAQALKRTLN